MTREEVRLRELEAHATIERRILGFHAALPRTAEKVHVRPLDTYPGLLLRSVACRRRKLPVLVFRQCHAHRHLRRTRFLSARLDIRKLEQRQRRQAALRALNAALTVRFALFERQLPLYHLVGNRRIPADLDGAEHGGWSRGGRVHDADLSSVLRLHLADRDVRVRVAELAKLVHDGLAAGADRRTIPRRPRLDLHESRQCTLVSLGQHIHALEPDRAHDDGGAFVDGDDKRHGLLVLVEISVNRRHLRVGIATIGIERLDALQIAA